MTLGFFIYIEYDTYKTININDTTLEEAKRFLDWYQSGVSTQYVLPNGFALHSANSVERIKVYEIDTSIHPVSEIKKAQRETLQDITTSEDDVFEQFGKDITSNLINRMNLNTATRESVLIVHGHDDNLKWEVKNILSLLGLSPIILHEEPNKGHTIIEKFEELANKASFAIVLYTACDIGGKDKANLKPRPRQNVVFEHGYCVSKYGRNRVAVIIDDGVEKPSDIDGILYINRRDWKNQIPKELKSAGFKIDLNNLV